MGQNVYLSEGTLIAEDGTVVEVGADLGGGSAGAAAQYADFRFVEADTAANFSHAIIAVDLGASTITLDGDLHDQVLIGADGSIIGSTSNDGQVFIDNVEIVGGDTVVTASPLVDDTVDGSFVFGLYQATMVLAAGTTVLDVVGLSLGDGWTAVEARLFAGDETNYYGYFWGIALDGLTAIDPTSPSTSSILGVLRNRNDGYAPPAYSAAAATSLSVMGVQTDTGTSTGIRRTHNALPIGVYYESPNTLTLSIVTSVATPPGAGDLLMRVVYVAATPEVVGLS